MYVAALRLSMLLLYSLEFYWCPAWGWNFYMSTRLWISALQNKWEMSSSEHTNKFISDQAFMEMKESSAS